MPLVEAVLRKFCIKDFSRVKIIGVQHILETTHAMFQYFYEYGLKPENVSILGKCYSTCKAVFEEMTTEGIDVSSGSFSYDSYSNFDSLFDSEVKKFIDDRKSDLLEGEYEAIIVLDDGGKCIRELSKTLKYFPVKVVGIEQTSAGYHAIKNTELPFPVINVARSPIKLTYESPMIAEAGAERLYISLKKKKIRTNKALIIGGGAIGQAMKERLVKEMEVVVFDENEKLSETKSPLKELLVEFPLIIGCTGRTSVNLKLHGLIKNTTLVSVSSSDREFDAVHLRKQTQKNNKCHKDLVLGTNLLVNSGFPVNFDGDRENIETEKIQLTIALISGAIVQAFDLKDQHKQEIIGVEPDLELFIERSFIKVDKLLSFSQ